MAYIKKLKIKGNYYYYLFHTIRHNNKFSKKSKYIGKTLPSNIEQIKQSFLQELKQDIIKPSSEMQSLIETLHPLERKTLPFLIKYNSLSKLLETTKLSYAEVMRALQWLENKSLINLESKEQQIINLDKNGLLYLKNGLPEKRFLKTLPSSIQELKSKFSQDEFNISIGILKKNLSININKEVTITDSGKLFLKKESLEEKFLKLLPLNLDNLTPEQKYAYNELLKRKQIIKLDIIKDKIASLTNLGKNLSKENLKVNLLEAVTQKIIHDESWKKTKFRKYDIKINVPSIYPGKRHFVNQAIDYARRIWLDLGFKEMKGPIIQTSFWNFDSLFTAQDHPVRDLQDTFYLKNPALGKLPNKELVEKVKQTHESGYTTKSTGWKYSWQEIEAKKNVLRTHTTVLSAHTLATLKQSDLPAKFFAIGRCFRNETLDWSHLFDFNQTEGIVVDENANFRHLIGYLKEFFTKMGFEKIRIRPAYFPYTEPSLEIDVLHPVHKKWIELGGAGIFRPEVVIPLLGKDIPVLAWGPGFDRIIMDYYKIMDIRDLYKNDLKQLREIKLWLK